MFIFPCTGYILNGTEEDEGHDKKKNLEEGSVFLNFHIEL